MSNLLKSSFYSQDWKHWLLQAVNSVVGSCHDSWLICQTVSGALLPAHSPHVQLFIDVPTYTDNIKGVSTQPAAMQPNRSNKIYTLLLVSDSASSLCLCLQHWLFNINLSRLCTAWHTWYCQLRKMHGNGIQHHVLPDDLYSLSLLLLILQLCCLTIFWNK